MEYLSSRRRLASRAIEEGRTITVRTPLIQGNMRVKRKVGPACADSLNGHWACVPCKEDFQNNLQKDCHINGCGRHELVWLCHEHGPEDSVPKDAEREE